MRQYLELMRDILDNGAQKGDRTGTGTLSVFGRQMRFDLSEGFPLLTTKRINVKAVINEFLWMIIHGSTDVKWLQDRGHTFWNPWMLEDCTIGKGYGYQLRRIEKVFQKPYSEKTIINCEYKAPFPLEYTLNHVAKSARIGEVYESKNYGSFVVIDKQTSSKDNRRNYHIHFLKTGFQTTICTSQFRLLEIKDPWYPKVSEVGFIGNPDRALPLYDRLHRTWTGMLSRCYNKDNDKYHIYGGRGVLVCDRWLCFENFQKDATTLPNWSLKREYPNDYTLDKDILTTSNGYSPETCMWASLEEQGRNSNKVKLMKATNKDGTSLLRYGIAGLSKATGCDRKNLFSVYKKELKSIKGWLNVEEFHIPGSFSVRIYDQVKKLVADLKYDPCSRRHIIDLWSPGDLEEQALPPCHMMTQWNVCDGKLDCLMYQRSADYFVGVPWNIAFYSLFTLVVAKIVGLQPGEFIWTAGDCHLYNNTLEQAKLQLTREPKKLPTMILKDRNQGLDDWEYEDFELVNYESHPGIKAQVSV